MGISYFTKIGALNTPAVQRGVCCAAVIKRGGLRLAAVGWRPCRHYSAARCCAGVIKCGGLRQNSRAEPASRARRTAAVEWRAGRLNSAADCGSTVAFWPPLQRGGEVALGPLATTGHRRQAVLRERRFAAVQRPTAPVESGGFRR